MKYMKRLKIYKAKNVTFNPATLDAYSYDWWRFVAVVEGKTIFNNYRYSVTTAKHQRKVHSLLSELGIRIDIELPLERGIRTDMTLSQIIVEAETTLCDQYLERELKQQDRAARAKQRRAVQREMERQRLEQRPHLSLADEGGTK